ncbi:GntR family transcriptional regulator [uncultured Sphaerochaeta sp.]|uniref:GntR family transcriptional regulator n=1 Tax=uncultured Sphaerochaeta sp. TaxID=886478 RepID=UPI002A0A1D1E|nr:GntR family transcriptional regulator [uncultured Sphaerochaeta sp.]
MEMSSGNNLKESAYVYIKERILNCEYLPGEILFEKQITDSIGAGRTPIREALITLQSENLVEIFPRKGTCAKVISKEDLMELFALRKLIEPASIIRNKGNIDLDKLHDFDLAFKDLSVQKGKEMDRRFYSLDIEFHQYLIDCSNNKRLTKIFGAIMQDTYRIGIYSTLFSQRNSKESTYQQHHRIINAILEENDGQIGDALYSHINYSLIASLETLRKKENKENEEVFGTPI